MKIKIYENNTLHCLSCFGRNHTVRTCPFLHFIPDRLFYIKRFAFTNPQSRALLPKPRKKFDFKSLKHLPKIQYAATKVDSGDDGSECSDESMEESIRRTEESIRKAEDDERKRRTSTRQFSNLSKNRRVSQLTFNLGENKIIRQPAGGLEEIKEVLILIFLV